jgi:hypothetical protein
VSIVPHHLTGWTAADNPGAAEGATEGGHMNTIEELMAHVQREAESQRMEFVLEILKEFGERKGDA